MARPITICTGIWVSDSRTIGSELRYARINPSTAGKTLADTNESPALACAMTLEQAIEYARNLSLRLEIAPAPETLQDGLTSREHEVAALIAKGSSNREIAGQLVISPRTVEKHIGNIKSKLGLNNRSQIVRWFMEHGFKEASE